MIIDPDDHPGRHSPDKAKRSEAFADAARRLKNEVLADPEVTDVHVMVGAPASGKSSWAKASDRRVIVDGCHAAAQGRRAMVKRIKDAGKVPIAVYMKTPRAEIHRRNDKRQPPKRVPRPVIERQLREIEKRPPRLAEGWAEVIEVVP